MGNIKKRKSQDKRKEDVKQNMRRMRERIKADPKKYEEQKKKERERYHKRRQEGKIKTISEKSDREKREIRKCWRRRSKKYRESKRKLVTYLENITPPASPQPEILNSPHVPGPSRQSELGKRLARKNRQEMKKEIERLRNKVNSYKRKVEKYKKRQYREKIKHQDPRSPTQKVEELFKHNPREAKRKLLLGEVITRQVKENCAKRQTIKEKHDIVSAISGPLIRKYKFQHVITSVSARLSRRINIKKYKKHRVYKHIQLKKCITNFLESDESSRMMPGKKDTITKHKCKKQRRLLNDSLQNLHIKFKQKFTQYASLSYPTFCKYRPFWILIPNAKSRETCLCISHENMALMVKKLRINKVINETFPDQLCKSLCCNNQLDEKCLARICEFCKDRQILKNEFDPEQKITYMMWRTKKEQVIVKGKEKICQKTVKENIESTSRELLLKLENSVLKFMDHLRNIYHQYKHIDYLKNNLSGEHILIHMDFSENYNCKYSQEVQSAHFGGSKPQVSLHTVVAYYKNPKSNTMEHINFCTISKNLRHDPPAILAHLEPIFSELLKILPNIKQAHFLSDGPSTQYRNRKMFYFLASHIPGVLKCEKMSWNYSESGHGKGAPDGIGGAVKRVADSAVAHGVDISSYEDLAMVLKSHCKKIKIYNIPEEKIVYYDSLLPQQLKAFSGTMKIHQLYWSNQYPKDLQCRSLSCCECDISCSHFNLGSIQFPNSDNDPHLSNEDNYSEKKGTHSRRLRYADVYSSDEDSNVEMDTSEKHNITGQKLTIATGKYVVVKFLAAKRIMHYIGLVLGEECGGECTVKFLRRKSDTKFVYPDQDDVAPVNAEDILRVLSNPNERRNQYYFTPSEIESIENLK